jgi:hypothetical protein
LQKNGCEDRNCLVGDKKGFEMRKYRFLSLSIITLLFLTSCATHNAPETFADPYGFFSGLWHGAIAVLTITVNIISWALSLIGISFFQDVQIIGRPNTGFFYYFGFLIGFFWLSIFG